ncbi:MAG: four helix bundle protein [Rubrobacter sp.]|nr:four helix bundle protein [Rubrobacter sp.]
MDLAEACYVVTKGFPREEVYGMTSQVRRAAAAIPANIAEGHGRESPRDFVRFLRIAQGSLRELETHLMLASRVRLAPEEEIEALLTECEGVEKMLRSLIQPIQKTKNQNERSDSVGGIHLAPTHRSPEGVSGSPANLPSTHLTTLSASLIASSYSSCSTGSETPG